MTGPEDPFVQTFSSVDFVGQCMIDRERTEAFERAVKEAVRPGMNGIDLGTGSGVLALFAARAGAQRITAIEFDHYIASIAKNNFELNGYADRIELSIGDARSYIFDKGKTVDFVLAELLTTGIVDEYQVQAINNLHKQGIITKDTRFIPEAQETYVALGYHDYGRYGINLPLVKHLWRFHRPEDVAIDLFTEKALLSRLDFAKPRDERFSKTIELMPTKNGEANCLHLSSRTVLSGTIAVGDTDSLNAPMAVPLPPHRLTKGEPVSVAIEYVYGSGYAHFKAKFL